MNITQEHLSYWRERKSTPRWASALLVSHLNPGGVKCFAIGQRADLTKGLP